MAAGRRSGVAAGPVAVGVESVRVVSGHRDRSVYVAAVQVIGDGQAWRVSGFAGSGWRGGARRARLGFGRDGVRRGRLAHVPRYAAVQLAASRRWAWLRDRSPAQTISCSLFSSTSLTRAFHRPAYGSGHRFRIALDPPSSSETRWSTSCW